MQINDDWLDLYRRSPDEGWDFFLDKHSRLIMAIARKMAKDHDQIMELYTYSLEQLKKNRCQKITAYYHKKRQYNFESWIAIVTKNCCLDWIRKSMGRKRLLKCIENLTLEEQWLFRYLYWYGYSKDYSYELLRMNHGYNGTLEDFGTLVHNLQKIVEQSTGHVIRQWSEILISSPDSEWLDHLIQKDRIPSANAPEMETADSEQSKSDCQKIVEQVLQNLSDTEQLMIRLRFFNGFTLEKMARILNEKNLWKVQRQLKKLLVKIKKQLEKAGIQLDDFDFS